MNSEFIGHRLDEHGAEIVLTKMAAWFAKGLQFA